VVLARYVEVNYVRAKVVGAGVCVQNGIVHKVDHILGIPGRSIYEEIAANPNLRWVTYRCSCVFVCYKWECQHNAALLQPYVIVIVQF